MLFLLIKAPLWRHNPNMKTSPQIIEQLVRQNLRLKAEIWDSIDSACNTRIGSISRNTWITEAILEKLERETSIVLESFKDGGEYDV